MIPKEYEPADHSASMAIWRDWPCFFSSIEKSSFWANVCAKEHRKKVQGSYVRTQLVTPRANTLGQVSVSCRHPQELCMPDKLGCLQRFVQSNKQVENTPLPKLLFCSQEAIIEIQKTKSVFQPCDAKCWKVSGLQWLSSQNCISAILTTANAGGLLFQSLKLSKSLTSPSSLCAGSKALNTLRGWSGKPEGAIKQSLVQDVKAIPSGKTYPALHWFKRPLICIY